jgi:hypothetical protein
MFLRFQDGGSDKPGMQQIFDGRPKKQMDVLTEVIWLSPEIGISESNPYKKQLFQTLE